MTYNTYKYVDLSPQFSHEEMLQISQLPQHFLIQLLVLLLTNILLEMSLAVFSKLVLPLIEN